MKSARATLLLVLIVGGFSAPGKTTSPTLAPGGGTKQAQELLRPQEAITPQDFPFAIFPSDARHVMSEGEVLIVDVFADCSQGPGNSATFQLAPSTPTFVTISTSCRCEGSSMAMAQLFVTPKFGDAGKYDVIVNVRTCSGLGGQLGFSLRVKRNKLGTP